MNNMCYIHSDTSTVGKNNILLSQASAAFSVCRCNDIIFKIYKCKKDGCSCNIHFYIKNCTCKKINNLNLRVKLKSPLNNDEYSCVSVGDLKPCEEITINKFIVKCNNYPTKLCGELLVGEDIVRTQCLII